MSLFKRGNVFYYDFWIQGKRFQGSTGKESKIEAQMFEDDLKRSNGKVPQMRKDSVEPGVYFLQSPATGLVKVGCSANITRRLADYKTENPEELFLLAKIPAVDYLKAEKEMHSFLEQFRERGEWFKIGFRHIEAAIGYWMMGHPAFGANKKVRGQIPPEPVLCEIHQEVYSGACPECLSARVEAIGSEARS